MPAATRELFMPDSNYLHSDEFAGAHFVKGGVKKDHRGGAKMTHLL